MCMSRSVTAISMAWITVIVVIWVVPVPIVPVTPGSVALAPA
jgi:hypothetical protein